MCESGDYFPSMEIHEKLSRNVGAKGVFKEFCIMATHAKDKEIASIAEDGVLEFVVMDLRKELMREREKKFVLT